MSFQISRRRFLHHSGALAGAAMMTPLDLFSKEKPLLSFGIVTDSHYADREPAGTRYFRDSLQKMREAMAEMNKQRLDFVVHLGDFKDQDEHPDENKTLAYLQKLEDSYAVFKGPRYHVLGNHDTDSISKKQFLQYVTNTGIDKNRSYYSFDQQGLHFVVLDADYKIDGTDYDKGNFEWTDSFIPDKQLQWLKDDLQKTKTPTVVFVHQLLDNVDDHDFCVKNADDVRDVIQKQKNVLAVFQGHRHKERYNKLENVHFCTLPGMVDFTGPESNSFSILEVYKSGDINMIGFQRAPDLQMKAQ
ncbi:MAG TPA: metallophosphoesterase [Cyclobacteriaceae bacterium]|nr:metallophosphoesterase [Cyclobacteriaceae bacterium]